MLSSIWLPGQADRRHPLPDRLDLRGRPGGDPLPPPVGSELATLAVRSAASLSALGAAGLTGYSPVSSNSEVVACGYTGTLVQYAASPAPSPQAAADAGGATVTRLADFAQYRVTLSSSFTLDIEINYSAAAEYTVFENVLNSIRYPFPECEAGHRVAEPSPPLSRPGCGRPSSRST